MCVLRLMTCVCIVTVWYNVAKIVRVKISRKRTDIMFALYPMVVITLFVTQSVKVKAMQIGDILNAEYLPSTLLLEEAEVDNAVPHPLFNITTDGQIKDAFRTMHYHRSMMNEYMCRNYIAEEILNEIEPNDIARLGRPAKPAKNVHRNHKPRQETLLRDQGSSAYKDWLSRSSVLNDVYHHYDYMLEHDEDSIDELESGDVTGYAVHSAPKSPPPDYGGHHYQNDYGGGGVGGGYHSGGGGTHHTGGGVHNNGGGSPHSGGGSSPHSGGGSSPHSGGGITGYGQDYYHHVGGGERGDEHYYSEPEEHSSGKGLALKDLFDLALTALAFLAFGLFIVNLIMMCLMGPQGTTIIMQTSTMTTTSTGEARDPSLITTSSGQRTKRMAAQSEELLNEMAYRVMMSIDRLTELNRPTNDTDQCLHFSLCENNKYSRSLPGNTRIWLPIWSFGVSWLGAVQDEDKMSLLRASVLGLGNADCNSSYPSCQVRRQ